MQRCTKLLVLLPPHSSIMGFACERGLIKCDSNLLKSCFLVTRHLVALGGACSTFQFKWVKISISLSLFQICKELTVLFYRGMYFWRILISWKKLKVLVRAFIGILMPLLMVALWRSTYTGQAKGLIPFRMKVYMGLLYLLLQWLQVSLSHIPGFTTFLATSLSWCYISYCSCRIQSQPGAVCWRYHQHCDTFMCGPRIDFGTPTNERLLRRKRPWR